MNEWLHPLSVGLFYLIHAIVVLIVFAVVKKRLKEVEQSAWEWIVVVSLFLPLIGELFGLIVWLVSKRWGTNDMLTDYDEYVTYKPMMLEQLREEVRVSDELLPFSEAFSEQATSNRKDLIIRLINSNIVDKGKYLSLGLANSDSETVHYAATTMNFLIDTFEKELQLKRREYDAGSPEALLPLLQVYDQYLKSGLLQQAAGKRLMEDYVQRMENAIAFGIREKWLYQMLGEAYLANGQTEKGIQTLESLIELFPTDSEGYLSLVRYHYDQKDWQRIRSILSDMRERVPEDKVPANQKFTIDQMWGAVQ
ncbi:tetratricopeptide repeat protein [Halobacillus litoralis]|uniref:tetratricopeptide repeat protein n=1 Tax=Halobacillus litoralis TaxID=45668 RepID=UPI001CD553AC|nr:tetratricopeptide repeat protein [Halobacillus litoralis]MCA0972053.1 tetratricopeptide repeat protein [Halobacillus litoralis]